MSVPTLNNTLFRQNAIQKLNSLDENHMALTVVNPSQWMWIGVFILSLVGIIMWGVFGSVTLCVESKGIILPDKTLLESELLIHQTINDNKEKIASLEYVYNQKKELYKKHYLTFVEVLKAKEEYMTVKENLSDPNKYSYRNLSEITLDNSINSVNTVLDAIVFINHAEGKKIVPGMTVYLLPDFLSVYDYGYIRGKVLSISEYPVTKQLAYSYLGNMNLVDDFFIDGSPFIAKIQLQQNRSTNSGLSWTTYRGPLFSIRPGTLVSANIVYKKCSPLSLRTRQ